MRAFVDPDLCIGCTQCAGICPAVFTMEGTLAVALVGEIPGEEVPAAVDGLPRQRHPHGGELSLLPKSPGSNCLPVIFFGRVLCYTIRCENSEWRIRNDAFTGH